MTEATEEMNSFVSDNSFVILGQGSLASDINGFDNLSLNSQYGSHNGLNNDKDTVNRMSESSQNLWKQDASSNDIQVKLDELVKENRLLKESLNQSNLAMKSQYDTLVLWHQEVVKTHDSHKQKFQETQNQINKLQTENASLKKQLEDSIECSSCTGGCGAVFVNMEGMSMNPSLTSLKQSLELCELKCKELNAYNKDLISKNEELEKVVSDLKVKNADVERKTKDSLEGSKNQKVSLISNSSLNDAVVPVKAEQSSVIKSTSQKTLDMSEVIELIEGVAECNINKASENDLLISQLKKQVAEQQEMLTQKSNKMDILKDQYEIMIKEHEEVKSQLQYYKNQVHDAEKQSQSLTSQLKEIEDLIQRKKKEYADRKKEMEDFTLSCEEVAILRTQMKQYQDDFNEERRAREQAVGEKEQMAEQVRLLERTLNESRKNEVGSQESSACQSQSSAPKKRQDRPYMCPRCCFRFPTPEELDSHIDSCLDLEMFP